MEWLYIFIVVLLFGLAISDLIVGVTNDAVNFLNSAIGAKVASFHVVMIIGALGVLAGTTFSSGMMEVARKGVFNPEQFYFSEVMLMFLGIMLTDILLLDFFNTFGLPTSTTVSVVFELLGAAVSMAIIKISQTTGNYSAVSQYINSSNVLLIVSSILLSVVTAFSFGALGQFITRLIFSFKYKKSVKFFGALFGGAAITAIAYFMILKGMKGASFITESTLSNIMANQQMLMLWVFAGSALLLQILHLVFKLNIFKLVVIAGTFALAMAFAGNDLVNFIGVPLAGYESFKIFKLSATAPDALSMGLLAGKVKTPTLLLLAAGAIMVITLFVSRKARTVVQTSVNLSRQSEGTERFESSMAARSIVRLGINAGRILDFILPSGVKNFISSRFVIPKSKSAKDLAFDEVRAAVNLVIASILIAYGTSHKLPLSTTYVTFMVAMGTSLADGAWDRESAVYRISGVLTVIGGWFLTAFSAFTVSFILVMILYYGAIPGLIGLLGLTVFLLVRTHMAHTRIVAEEKEQQEWAILKSPAQMSDSASASLARFLSATTESLSKGYLALMHDHKKEAAKSVSLAKKNNQYLQKEKANMYKQLRRTTRHETRINYLYATLINELGEASGRIKTLSNKIFKHIDNNHAPMVKYQREKTPVLLASIEGMVKAAIDYTRIPREETLQSFNSHKQTTLVILSEMKNEHIAQMAESIKNAKLQELYLEMLEETGRIINSYGRSVETLANIRIQIA